MVILFSVAALLLNMDLNLLHSCLASQAIVYNGRNILALRMGLVNHMASANLSYEMFEKLL